MLLRGRRKSHAGILFALDAAKTSDGTHVAEGVVRREFGRGIPGPEFRS